MIFHGDFWFFHAQNSTVTSGIFKKFGVQNGVLEGVRVPIFLDFTGFFEGVPFMLYCYCVIETKVGCDFPIIRCPLVYKGG